jgi:hypothetical protein
MGRCEDFYNKWRRDPNWCEKSPGAVSQINAYIEVIDLLEADGIPQSFTIVNLPEGVARPIVSIRDPVVKDAVLAMVRTSLKSKKKYREVMQKGDPDCGTISSADIRSIIKAASPAKEPYRTPIPIPIIGCQPKIKVDRSALIGSVIVEWEFINSITVEKEYDTCKKRYEINFDAYSGKAEIFEV